MIALVDSSANLPELDIRKYRSFNPALYRRLISAAKKVEGRVVVHVSATASGGGVAELLASQIALERALGLKSYWLTMKAPVEFFEVTKKIHNLLQSKPGNLTEKEKSIYQSVNHELCSSLHKFLKNVGGRGIVFVQDPQPLALINCIPKDYSPLLRLHIELSTPNAPTLNFLRPYIEQYKHVILHSKVYFESFPWLPQKKRKIIINSIDPRSPKNRPMDLLTAESILEQFEINCEKPIIAQVSRFDPWKDPLGVIKAYYLAKNEIPDLQLILAGFSFAQDDPESAIVFEKVQKHAKGDPDIFLFADPKVLGDLSNDTFINAVYTASNVVVQKSIREGFGLTMTEAMWKGKPLVAGKTIGALMQVKHNKNGILVSSPEEAARAIVHLIKNPKFAKHLGNAAHRSVRDNFLFTRYLLDHVRLYSSVL